MTSDPSHDSFFARLLLTGKRTLRFSGRVLKRFSMNKGLLLSGGVAYNTLLSIVPLFAVILVALTHFVEADAVFDVIRRELALIAPGQANTITEELEGFYVNRHLIGGVGAVVLLFFSSLAFRMLEDAFAIIFAGQVHKQRKSRSFWVSALIPYAYIGLITISLLAITVVSGALEALSNEDLQVIGTGWSFSDISRFFIFASGLVGEVFLFTSVFRIMPVSDVAFKRSLVGGVVTTILWEMMRQILHWYFANLSLVAVIYGSFATVIVVLLFMEVATIMLLVGAQVIAELEASARAGLRWFEPVPYQPLNLAAPPPPPPPTPQPLTPEALSTDSPPS